MNDTTEPYWQLSRVYFFYFASLGILMPYLGLYLTSLGISALQVGVVFAVIQGTKIVAPNIWAWLADHYHNRIRMVQIAAFLSTLVFSAFLFETKFLVVVFVSFVFSFFWNAMLPQFEAVTLNMLGNQTAGYSRIRLWGSVGFIVSVAGGGVLLNDIGIDYWPLATFVCLGFVFVSSLFVRETGRFSSTKEALPLTTVLMNKQVVAFFVVLFLIQASHGPYYSFFSIMLADNGYNDAEIGQMWSLGVIAEILLFLVMQHVFSYSSVQQVLLFSILLTIIRWLMTAWFADDLVILLTAQLLHAASFGAFHVVCIQYVHTYFTGVNQVRGQALYSSVGFGAGGMFGSLIAGSLWDEVGAEWVFTVAALLSLIAFFVAWVWLGKGTKNVLAAEIVEKS